MKKLLISTLLIAPFLLTACGNNNSHRTNGAHTTPSSEKLKAKASSYELDKIVKEYASSENKKVTRSEYDNFTKNKFTLEGAVAKYGTPTNFEGGDKGDKAIEVVFPTNEDKYSADLVFENSPKNGFGDWILKKKSVVETRSVTLSVYKKPKLNIKKSIKVDYSEAEAEKALNDNKDLTGKTVKLTAQKIEPASAFGYKVEAGKHLNFVSEDNPKVQTGDILIVRVKKVKSVAGSFVIYYDMLSKKHGSKHDDKDSNKNTEEKKSTDSDNNKNVSSSKKVSSKSADNDANTMTLSEFVNKYGMSPAAYKMEHEGMSQKQALASTPDGMKSSGEKQTEYQMKNPHAYENNNQSSHEDNTTQSDDEKYGAPGEAQKDLEDSMYQKGKDTMNAYKNGMEAAQN